MVKLGRRIVALFMFLYLYHTQRRRVARNLQPKYKTSSQPVKEFNIMMMAEHLLSVGFHGFYVYAHVSNATIIISVFLFWLESDYRVGGDDDSCAAN